MIVYCGLENALCHLLCFTATTAVRSILFLLKKASESYRLAESLTSIIHASRCSSLIYKMKPTLGENGWISHHVSYKIFDFVRNSKPTQLSFQLEMALADHLKLRYLTIKLNIMIISYFWQFFFDSELFTWKILGCLAKLLEYLVLGLYISIPGLSVMWSNPYTICWHFYSISIQ